jgi:hypothetical protein
MPEQKTLERAKADKAEGKARSTQAGEFVKEEMDHIREGKHGAQSTEQAIAIGLSKARRAGVKLPPPKKGKVSEAARKTSEQDLKKAKSHSGEPSAKRSEAVKKTMNREPRTAASTTALSKHARKVARRKAQE